MQFEWDNIKNETNINKHNADFEDAKELFSSETFLFAIDNRFNYKEDRYIGYGKINNRLFSVAYMKRDNNIRIISFRKANDREVKRYEEEYANRLAKD